MAREQLDKTLNRLWLLIRAGYPVIYIVSHEEWRVLDYLAKIYRLILAENPGKMLLRYQEGLGLQRMNANWPPHTIVAEPNWLNLQGLPPGNLPWVPAGDSPSAAVALEVIKQAGDGQVKPGLDNSLTVFFDVHRQMTDEPGANLVRPMRNAADALRRYYEAQRIGWLQQRAARPPGARQATPQHKYKTIVIVAPGADKVSSELERDLIKIDFPLPGHDELLLVLDDMVNRQIVRFPDTIPQDDIVKLFEREQQVHQVSADLYQSRLKELVAAAGRGLALEDYKLGLNQMAVEDQRLNPGMLERMLNLKSKAINNRAIQYTPNVNVELGGLEKIKQWMNTRRGAVISEAVRREFHLPAPKGVMLCGASGGGKSRLAQLIATQFNLALLRLDVGALFGSYVGESERNARDALSLAELLAPVVLWIDEIDKAFIGAAGGAGGDGGVSTRVLGYFLTWLSEKDDNVFVVATANRTDKLFEAFPEFSRKGRFDEIFWVALPDETARQEIFRIYLESLQKNGFLAVSDEQLEALARNKSLDSVPWPAEASAFDRLCWLLSRDDISGTMTGAEIEYAVIDAKYKAYDTCHNTGHEIARLDPEMVFDAVRNGRERALNQGGVPGEQEASRKRWIGAPGV